MAVSTLSRQTIDTDTAQRSVRYTFLVIGYGNELRGDDAVGAQVAKAVANWHLSEVKAIVTHQLLPELAVEIAKANYVIFVDACGEESCARNVQLTPMVMQRGKSPSVTLAHTHSAEGLLALTQKVYGFVPQAWLLQVPTESFGFGKQLSSIAHRGIDEAVQTIERFYLNYQVPYFVTFRSCMKSA